MNALNLLALLTSLSVRDLDGHAVDIAAQTTIVTWSVDCLTCLEDLPTPGPVVYVNTDPVSRTSEVRHAARLLHLPGPVVNDPGLTTLGPLHPTPPLALACR